MSSPETVVPRRRASVFLMATLSAAGMPAQRCRVRNLSNDGLCAEKPVGLSKGQRLTVAVGLVERAEAEVMWVRDGFAGLRFLNPIDMQAARSRPAQSLDPKVGWGRPIS